MNPYFHAMVSQKVDDVSYEIAQKSLWDHNFNNLMYRCSLVRFLYVESHLKEVSMVCESLTNIGFDAD